ncbi:MAG: hypothetical protein EOM05_04690 [Clostridia bacterium]|nr:hypothetical protein [Clostridia bacterium]
MMKKQNSYPVICVHGFAGFGEDELLSKMFPYFGLWNGDVRKTSKNLGLECHIPSLGPFSSAWDRACELYAHIVGGTVDYGKVHSEKNGHKRFGRTYDALIPDWGQLDEDGKIKKINLIAHSFGGPTSRLFIQLLNEGSMEEVEGTSDGELSGLFKGGHANWIHSLTNLASSNEGISLVQAFGKSADKIWKGILLAAGIIGNSPVRKIYDFGLDQFGITNSKKNGFKFGVNMKAIDKYIANKADNQMYELSIEGAQNLTKDMHTYDSIYYFSYAGCRTKNIANTNLKCPTSKLSPLLVPFGMISSNYKNFTDTSKPMVTDAWLSNDGCVPVISALAPLNEAQADFDCTGNCVPGIWYKMSIEDKDHMSYMGMGENVYKYSNFMQDILTRVCSLESVESANSILNFDDLEKAV